MAITEARAAGYDVLIENSLHTAGVVLARSAIARIEGAVGFRFIVRT